jgi:hypothetical protein
MPDREDSFWQMVGDIVRETSPIMRCCVLLGLGAGMSGAIWVIVKVMMSLGADVVYFAPRFDSPALLLGLIFFGGVLGGMVLGLVVGVVIELILEHLLGIKFDVPGVKKRKKRKY